MWLIYINDNSDKTFPGFTTLKDDINKLRKKGETEYYIRLFINVTKSFEDIFNNMKQRKK